MCRGLISFSMYGNVVKYVFGLYENLKLAPVVYPGWKVRVYIDKGHYAIDKIKRDWPDTEVVEKEKVPGSSGMFWRLEAAYDTNYTHAIVRDVDSRLTPREADLVKQWVKSDRSLHIIRDHHCHNGVPILGGAHGYKTSEFQHLKDRIAKWNHTHKYGDDEHFLRKEIHERVPNENRIAHSSQGKHYGDEKLIPPADNGFICQPTVPPFQPYLTKLYVLSPDHYRNRYAKFLEAVKTSKILSNLEVIKVTARPLGSDVIPTWSNPKLPHYWLASQDHKQILKERILAKDDLTLVFEDDAHPIEEFDEYFQRAWDYADPYFDHQTQHKPWTALMLGGQWDQNRRLLQNHTALQIAKTIGTRGQHSILYNYQGMVDFYSHAVYWNWKTIDEAFESYQSESDTVYCPAKWITRIAGVQYGKDD